MFIPLDTHRTSNRRRPATNDRGFAKSIGGLNGGWRKGDDQPALGDAISWQSYLLSEFEHPDFSFEATLAKRRLVSIEH
jgi:hypothetical protein